jgi:hypothetical protein
MNQRDTLMGYLERTRTAVGFLLVAGLAQACALSHEPPEKSPPDPSTNAVPPGTDSTAETAPGSDDISSREEQTGETGSAPVHPGTGGAPAGSAGSTNSSTEEGPFNGAESAGPQAAVPAGPQTIDQWRGILPRAGIDADNPEQLPVGVWIGETREPIACLASPRVVIEIAVGNDPGSAFGFVVFGEGEPPPPVSDPDVGYPPSEDLEELWWRLTAPSEGFAYTILEGHVRSSGRLQFRIAVVEEYEPWCALQTSYLSGVRGLTLLTDYSCSPDPGGWAACSEFGVFSLSSPPPDAPDCPLDYNKVRLCDVEDGPCICTREGCIANMSRTFLFDLLLTGNEMEGLVANTEVRLRKVK